MLLAKLLQYLPYEEVIGDTNVEILGLCANSKTVQKGELFFCYKGESVDSHAYLSQAASFGAIACVCEVADKSVDIVQIVVKDGRKAMAQFARAFYGFPDKSLKLIAITGTNGKTTTSYMLDSIFKAAGKSTAIIGTLGITYSGKFISPELTTPDPIFLYKAFADMRECGVEFVFMEVSAHAIYFKKIEGLTFEVAIYTNCTQDHLDFFKNMQAYFECKKSLFTTGVCKKTVINSDDKFGLSIIKEAKDAITYGLKNPADVFAVNILERVTGTSFLVNAFDGLYDISLRLPAIHNVYNAMAAISCACLLQIPLSVCAKGLYNLKKVAGRLERVAGYNNADIFVDFAHTPDGLEKSLQALKKLCKGKLYCLFGCGGNRDKTKRPQMGEIATKYADFCIITSDNPRYEDPYDIIFDIEKGIRGSKKYVTITDRETATEYALKLLDKGDILLVAGKGGENYQEIMGIKHAYNDNTIIKNLIS
ncbi:MAG: UDP-N-acetylmuramoyl-L-alanyl-D-glutamate--2,6-diaminopimelate ligase [Clostridiales bacterium]|nr:UDP-N-acetylmuramoyl-L-alanyl-D-glutamate--2,6-diaminopimelate ligase [Clostridiales bacterium]